MLDLGPATIRPFRDEDVASLARHADNPKIAAQLRDRFPHPYTATHAPEWIARTRNEKPARRFAIAADGEAIGSIGLELPAGSSCRVAELGYWLAESHWGLGIATLAVRAFSDFAFREYDLIRIFAYVFDGNPASARVLEKTGFRFRGRLRMSVIKHGHALDQCLYTKGVKSSLYALGRSMRTTKT